LPSDDALISSFLATEIKDMKRDGTDLVFTNPDGTEKARIHCPQL